jgi:hypothetical protein
VDARSDLDPAADLARGLAPRSQITWRTSARHGRGVFATGALSANTIVERAPAIVADGHDKVRPYLFVSDRGLAHESPGAASGFVLVLGLMSLCNHSAQPNAEVALLVDEGAGLLAVLTTTVMIAANQELVIHYPDVDYYREHGLA